MSDEEVIEVEKKLFLTLEQRQTLYTSLGEARIHNFTDVYFDGSGYPLTTKDWWLRQRDAVWELKIPWSAGQGLASTQSYEEVTDAKTILRRLQSIGMCSRDETEGTQDSSQAMEGDELLEQALCEGSVQPFAKILTERVSLLADGDKYDVRSIQVDLDTVTFDASHAETEPQQDAKDTGDAPFVIAEIEVMTSRRQLAVDNATAAIDAFMTAYSLMDAPKAYSKLIEYLLRFRPAHLRALSAADIIPEETLTELIAMRTEHLRQ